MKNKNIFLFGFWGLEIMYYHMIKIAREKNINIDWTILLITDHHKKLLESLLGIENVLVLDRSVKNIEPINYNDISYPGNLHKDIESEKRTFKYRNADQQKNIALKYYRQIIKFAEQHQPTHFLASRIEGIEGKLFISAGKKLNAEIIVPTHLRNLGGWFFSKDDRETLPLYYGKYKSKCKEEAIDFFEENQRRKFSPPQKINDNNLNDTDDPPLENFKQTNFLRIISGVKRLLDGRTPFEYGTLRYIFLMNFPLVRETIWWVRKKMALNNYDMSKLDQLPKKFIYYPIQYSPESSINTPSPFYIDQTRAIDAIRFSMPNDHALVLKEHPNVLTVRPLSFIRKLKKKSGVIIIKSDVDSNEIIKKAALTISVTGTSTFESFLIAKQSINLGHSFISSAINNHVRLSELEETIKKFLNSSIDKSSIIEVLSKLISVRYNFIFCQPGEKNEPLLRKKNITEFLLSLLDHINRIDHFKREL